MKKDNIQIFEKSFIGFEERKTYKTNYDILIGKFGNPVIGIKITNLVLQYSADAELYQTNYKVFNQ